jgi:hypothetical protein
MKNPEKENRPAGRSAKSPTVFVPLSERAAFTPNEFAALFGHRTTWGYRLIYSGQVRTIQNLGRLLIPRSEVDRLSNAASAEYSPNRLGGGAKAGEIGTLPQE